MIFLASAFVLGLLGSLHCLGMCGPLVVAMPIIGNTWLKTTTNALIYHGSRIIAYGLLGILPGIIGEGIGITQSQKWISIILGVMFLITAILSLTGRQILNLPSLSTWSIYIQNFFSRWTSSSGPGRLVGLGFVNGLIPCGMVYMAMAAALGGTNLLLSVLYMILFGIGTAPMLIMISLFQHANFLKMKKYINRLIPISLALIGLIFLWRGFFVEVPMDLMILRDLGWDVLCH
jgi:sulfite exporter TauE/SafE